MWLYEKRKSSESLTMIVFKKSFIHTCPIASAHFRSKVVELEIYVKMILLIFCCGSQYKGKNKRTFCFRMRITVTKALLAFTPFLMDSCFREGRKFLENVTHAELPPLRVHAMKNVCAYAISYCRLSIQVLDNKLYISIKLAQALFLKDLWISKSSRKWWRSP